MNRLHATLLALFIAIGASAQRPQFATPQQEADYRALIQELRCPQCQNNNIADSNASIATDMRHKTAELLQQGKTKQEVVEYMIARYGNFVSYDPPITPATLLLWLMPPLLIIIGLVVLFGRRKTAKQAVENGQKFANADQARLKQILNDKEPQ